MPVNLLYSIKYTLHLNTSTLCFNVSLSLTNKRGLAFFDTMFQAVSKVVMLV